MKTITRDPFAAASPDVLPLVYRFEMVGLDAGGVLAEVMDLCHVVEVSDEHQVGEPRRDGCSGVMDVVIPGRASMARPHPAASGFDVNFAKKAQEIFLRHSFKDAYKITFGLWTHECRALSGPA